jgi:tRNA(Glu) U13 pseudouridine synthase TruD
MKGCVVVQALAKYGARAWLRAVQAIPRHIRTMYMHAVQSFIWNSVASARLRMHGRQVVAGDLVLAGGVWPDGGDAESQFNSNTCTACKLGAVAGDTPDAGGAGGGEGHGNKGRKRPKTDANGTAPDRTARARMDRVAVVTQDDVAEGRYTIEDVVLPLPGSDVEYPAWAPGAQLKPTQLLQRLHVATLTCSSCTAGTSRARARIATGCKRSPKSLTMWHPLHAMYSCMYPHMHCQDRSSRIALLSSCMAVDAVRLAA